MACARGRWWGANVLWSSCVMWPVNSCRIRNDAHNIRFYPIQQKPIRFDMIHPVSVAIQYRSDNRPFSKWKCWPTTVAYTVPVVLQTLYWTVRQNSCEKPYLAQKSTDGEWSTIRLTGHEKLTWSGSLPNWQTASLIAARSTSAGKPLHKPNAHSQYKPFWNLHRKKLHNSLDFHSILNKLI